LSGRRGTRRREKGLSGGSAGAGGRVMKSIVEVVGMGEWDGAEVRKPCIKGMVGIVGVEVGRCGGRVWDCVW
jgi:hypothetical protein